MSSAITEAIQQIANEKSQFPPDVESLCTFVGHELLSLKKKTSFKKCKWEILKVIREQQQEEDAEDSS